MTGSFRRQRLTFSSWLAPHGRDRGSRRRHGWLWLDDSALVGGHEHHSQWAAGGQLETKATDSQPETEAIGEQLETEAADNRCEASAAGNRSGRASAAVEPAQAAKAARAPHEDGELAAITARLNAGAARSNSSGASRQTGNSNQPNVSAEPARLADLPPVTDSDFEALQDKIRAG